MMKDVLENPPLCQPIFSFMNISNLASCAQVSKTFKQTAYSNASWKPHLVSLLKKLFNNPHCGNMVVPDSCPPFLVEQIQQIVPIT
jgi:hypothetical protein